MLKTATSLLFYATAFCAAARAAVPFLPPVTLYVANEGQIDGSGSSVSVIDARNLRTKATIDFGKAGPIYALASPDGKFLWAVHYVYNYNTGVCDGSGVSVVSLATMKIETSLNLPQCPTTLAFSPNGRFAYVPSPAGPLTVIDTATRQAVASITVSTGQYGIAVSPDGRWLYLADVGDANLTVVDTTTNMPVRQIALNSGAFSLVLTSDGKRAFVWTASATASFEELRLSDGASLAIIPPTVSTELEGLAITPNGQLLLDVDYDAQTVWLYSTHAQSQIGSITGFSYPEGLALSPDGGVVYVTNNNCAAFPCASPGFVTAVSTRTHAVLGTIPVGINPQFITAFSGPGLL
jgi:DNA-binding beta-propeller fold protein YncE